MPGIQNTLTIHPLFVHFPIALTLSALLFEGLYVIRHKDLWRQIATALIYLAALAALVTVLTGYLAATTLGHEAPGHELVHIHRDIMVVFTILLVSIALLNVIISRPGSRLGVPGWKPLVRPALLLLAGGILVVGTDRGAELVFRYGMGVKLDSLPAEVHNHSNHEHGRSTQETETEASNEENHEGHQHKH
ncbi:MAG: hypothetical protein IH971_01255 [Candidatus Marinimicrobia bacterium]|nr:hypothetical protein [Candidatus Neomarinimicrobiota bacterium]